MPLHLQADGKGKAGGATTRVLGFTLAEDTDMGGGKRWVVVAPPGSAQTRLLLAKLLLFSGSTGRLPRHH